ncbi:DUF4012 domain-containing protein [Patescibacteria group bacterium]|nr:DUF4012 domain-containing protein [Patescibacteria group bacterium]
MIKRYKKIIKDIKKSDFREKLEDIFDDPIYFLKENINYFKKEIGDEKDFKLYINNQKFSLSYFLKKIKRKIMKLKNYFLKKIKNLKNIKIKKLPEYYWKNNVKNFILILSIILFLIFSLDTFLRISKDAKKLKISIAYAEEMAKNGVSDIINSDIINANKKIYLAVNSIYNLKYELEILPKILNSTKFITNINTGDIEKIARNGEDLSNRIFSLLKNLNKESKLQDKFFIINNEFKYIKDDINSINNIINSVNIKFIPKKYKEDILKLKNSIYNLNKNIDKINEASEVLSNILGEDDKKRYLIIFQNSNEIRATGGFMGSYALVDFYKGEIIKYEVPEGGIYDLKAGFYKNIRPPKPFDIMIPKWEIQDSNWFFDFEESAKTIDYFFENSSRTSVDGIIAINSNILKDLFSFIGDIELNEYNIILDSENPTGKIQNIVSLNKNTNKPKEIINSLFKEVSEGIFNIDESKIFELLNFLNDSINKKNIVIYSKDQITQEKIIKLGFSGKISNISQKDDKIEDYLAIVDTNIGGGKTSEFINREVKHNIKIYTNGDIISEIKINREFKENEELKDQEIKINREFIRIYTPYGSELIENSGFTKINTEKISDIKQEDYYKLDNLNKYSYIETDTGTFIYNDEGKTIFGNFSLLKPGESQEIRLKYKLPFKISYNSNFLNNYISYYLNLQKQAGIDNMKYSFSIEYPENKLKKLTEIKNNFSILEKDELIGIVFTSD